MNTQTDIGRICDEINKDVQKINQFTRQFIGILREQGLADAIAASGNADASKAHAELLVVGCMYEQMILENDRTLQRSYFCVVLLDYRTAEKVLTIQSKMSERERN